MAYDDNWDWFSGDVVPDAVMQGYGYPGSQDAAMSLFDGPEYTQMSPYWQEQVDTFLPEIPISNRTTGSYDEIYPSVVAAPSQDYGYASPQAVAVENERLYGGQPQGGFLDTLGGYADRAETGLKKYSTLAGLGMGGLQMWAAMKEKEKMEARRRQLEDEQRAAIAQMQAKRARMDAPIDMQSPAYSQARAPLSGFKDMRKEGSSRWFAPSTGNLAAAFQQEAKRAAEGGLMGGDEDCECYAQGGLGALRGPTGGQDDKIPAMLSHGEYVMDAESVSALGDGNTAAGAKKLDEMRVKIRKHKRKGPLSSIPKKAKEPMKYLEGGKV